MQEERTLSQSIITINSSIEIICVTLNCHLPHCWKKVNILIKINSIENKICIDFTMHCIGNTEYAGRMAFLKTLCNFIKRNQSYTSKWLLPTKLKWVVVSLTKNFRFTIIRSFERTNNIIWNYKRYYGSSKSCIAIKKDPYSFTWNMVLY